MHLHIHQFVQSESCVGPVGTHLSVTYPTYLTLILLSIHLPPYLTINAPPYYYQCTSIHVSLYNPNHALVLSEHIRGWELGRQPTVGEQVRVCVCVNVYVCCVNVFMCMCMCMCVCVLRKCVNVILTLNLILTLVLILVLTLTLT